MTVSNKSKAKRNVPTGLVKVLVTPNNAFVNFTDPQGNTLAQSTGGAAGFKNGRKASPHAGGQTVKAAAEKVKAEYGMKTATVQICGIGHQREAILRELHNHEITITSIIDNTPIPHNGTRPRKTRRV